MTKDPTSCYMFVMKYYKFGSLYSYFDKCNDQLYWRDILEVILSISKGLEVIHEFGLVHGCLHGGNILVEPKKNVYEPPLVRIADTGLHGPADKGISSKIYGVIPFV